MCSYDGHGNILRCLWSNFFQFLAFGHGSWSCDLSPRCLFAFGDIFLEVDEVEFVRNGCDQREEHQVGGEDRSLHTHLLKISLISPCFFFLPVITLNVTVTTSNNEMWHEVTSVEMLEMEDVEVSLVFQEAAETGWGLEGWRAVQTGSHVEVQHSVDYLSRVSLLKLCLNGIQIYFLYLKIDRLKMSFSVAAAKSPNKTLKYSSKRFGSARNNIRCTDWIWPLFHLGPKPFCRISRFFFK